MGESSGGGDPRNATAAIGNDDATDDAVDATDAAATAIVTATGTATAVCAAATGVPAAAALATAATRTKRYRRTVVIVRGIVSHTTGIGRDGTNTATAGRCHQ